MAGLTTMTARLSISLAMSLPGGADPGPRSAMVIFLTLISMASDASQNVTTSVSIPLLRSQRQTPALGVFSPVAVSAYLNSGPALSGTTRLDSTPGGQR
jgi:hypothetical protein